MATRKKALKKVKLEVRTRPTSKPFKFTIELPVTIEAAIKLWGEEKFLDYACKWYTIQMQAFARAARSRAEKE